MKSFASDNYSGVHSKVLEKITEINEGHMIAYGEDEYTAKVKDKIRAEIGDAEIFFVYNGTGANVLALETMGKKYSGILCPETAHIVTHETGAPVRYTGKQLFQTSSSNGKINLEEAKNYIKRSANYGYHSARPDLMSITQPTEVGTVYSIEELKKIKEFCKENNLFLHMDGARISNAAVALGKSIKEISKDMGVDVLSLGMTKNGVMFGEALVFFNKAVAKDFMYIRKQGLQLHSKIRFISAQYDAMFSDRLWYKNAKNANDVASYLESELENIKEINITKSAEGNTLYAILPEELINPLQEVSPFYVWNELTNECRFVTSFDSTNEDVDKFVGKIKELLK